MGGDPHYAIPLPTGQLLCFTLHGDSQHIFNLISNSLVHVNARFVPDPRRQEVTWIGSVGISILGSVYRRDNTTKLQFDAAEQRISVGRDVVLKARNVEKLIFSSGKLSVSDVFRPKSSKDISVAVELEDMGLSFTVFFKKNHLDIGWNRVSFQGRDSHGILGENVACTCTCGTMNRLEVVYPS